MKGEKKTLAKKKKKEEKMGNKLSMSGKERSASSKQKRGFYCKP